MFSRNPWRSHYRARRRHTMMIIEGEAVTRIQIGVAPSSLPFLYCVALTEQLEQDGAMCRIYH